MIITSLSLVIEVHALLYFQEPIKAIQFSGANPVCHHFDEDSKDGNDLLIGLSTGDGAYYSMLPCLLWIDLVVYVQPRALLYLICDFLQVVDIVTHHLLFHGLFILHSLLLLDHGRRQQ